MNQQLDDTIKDTNTGRIPTKSKTDTLLTPGSILFDRFEVIKTVGQGGMGIVSLVRCPETKRTFAVKTPRVSTVGDIRRNRLIIDIH